MVKEEKVSTSGTKGARKKQLERRLHALTARVTYLESSQAESELRAGEFNSQLSKLKNTGDLAEKLRTDSITIRKELKSIAERLEDLEQDLASRAKGEEEARLELLQQSDSGPQAEAQSAELAAFRTELNVVEERLEGMEQSLFSSVASRLEELEQERETQKQLVSKAAVQEEDLDALRNKLDAVATHLEETEQGFTAEAEQAWTGYAALESSAEVQKGELAAVDEKLGLVSQRLNGMEETVSKGVEERLVKLERIDPRLYALAEDVEQYRLEQSTLLSRVDDLKEHEDRWEESLRYATERAEALTERDTQLEGKLGELGGRVGDLKAELETTSATMEAIGREDVVRKQAIATTDSRVHTLTWVGAIALLALGAGLLLFIYKQRSEQDAMESGLSLVEQRLSDFEAQGTGRVSELATQLTAMQADLNRQGLQINDLQQDENAAPEAAAFKDRVDTLGDELSQIKESLDGLDNKLIELENKSQPVITESSAEFVERLARLENQSPAASMEDLAKMDERLVQLENQSMAAKQEMQAQSTAADQPPSQERQNLKENPWPMAQEQRRFTVQVLGVSNRAALYRFAQRHRLAADSAWLEKEHMGKPWFVLFHGIYESRSQAAKAARQLAATFPDDEPWVLRIPRRVTIQPLEP